MENMRARRAKLLAHAALQEEPRNYAEAWTHVNEALNVDMDDPEALYMGGVIMRHLGYLGMAAQLFRRTCAMDPNEINPWMHFGATMHDLHYYDEALKIFGFCKTLAPQEPTLYANIAAAHQQLGNFAEAYNAAEEALKRKPEHAQALSIKALACLGLGRWKEGFSLYRHMYDVKIKTRTYGSEDQPDWNGQKGQTVVIQGDQGLGDEIMYSSVLPDAAKDATLIVDCHPKMVNVFRRSFPGIEFHGTRKDLVCPWLEGKQIDARYHISGLGRFYRTRDKDFPRQPYLAACPELRYSWRRLLEKYPRPWVGLTWQGGSIATMREFRSVTPDDWAPVIQQGGTFFDLSYHDSRKEIEGTPIVRFDIPQADYDHTLALIAELDLVVSVTTTVVHACGALGKKALVLVPKTPQWRYGTRRDDVQWYPKDSVTLFRQGQDDGDFTMAISEIAKAYEGFLVSNQSVFGVRPPRARGLPRLQRESDSEQQPASGDSSAVSAPA